MSSAVTGARAVLEQLAADGVSYIFGNPGTVEQGFLDALTSFPDITYIETLQESVAVAIADAYARSTKRVAVIQLHSSPGLGNGIGMLYQARRGEAPLLVLAGEAGTQFDAMDAQMAADLVAMAEPVTKFSTRVIHPTSLLRTVRKAIKIASSHPMGPTFVALPMDVLDAECTEQVHPTSLPDFRSVAHPDAVETIARALAGAQHPIIIVGDGVAAVGAQEELRSLAESVGAAVWEANGSEVNMPFSHPAYQGALGHMFGHVSRAIVDKADVVLICGTYVFPEVFPALEGVFAPDARVFHVDTNPYEIAKNFPVELGLVCDPRETLAAIAGSVDAVASDSERAAAADRLTALTEQRSVSRAQAPSSSATNAGEPVTAEHFVAALAEALPDDVLIFDEALTMSDVVKRHLGSDMPGTYFQTRGGSLGVGIPGRSDSSSPTPIAPWSASRVTAEACTRSKPCGRQPTMVSMRSSSCATTAPTNCSS